MGRFKKTDVRFLLRKFEDEARMARVWDSVGVVELDKEMKKLINKYAVRIKLGGKV